MKPKIYIYSTPTCHNCVMVKDYLKRRGLEYTEYDVKEDIQKRREMVDISGQMGVPVTKIDDKIVVGYDLSALEDLFDQEI